MITFDSYYNGDDENSSFMNEINYIVRQANEKFVQCEQKLEQFIETELIEILVDDRGNFHYRVTEKGRAQLREDGFAIPPGDNFINPWRLA
jgi:predicted transcriptional regulator